jgi:hypothetical protein
MREFQFQATESVTVIPIESYLVKDKYQNKSNLETAVRSLPLGQPKNQDTADSIGLISASWAVSIDRSR